MISKIRIKLDERQMDVVSSFANQVGLPVEDFCRQAVFYAINDATKRAEAAQAHAEEMATLQGFTDGTHDSEPADTERTIAPDEVSTTSDAFPDTQAITDQQV